ncbi:MAG TPA: VWA domain-containing protein [Pyrinomonadaceae bacterium]|nr:VWA domain-containing protein [Pyrinomonadaceae bacterium]
MKCLGVLLLVFTLVLVAEAQQPSPSPQPRPSVTPKPERPISDDDVVRITTNLVQVDAVVLDDHGKVVTDLRPEEIQIFEDNRAQKITHLSYVVTESGREGIAPAPKAVDKSAPPLPPTSLRPDQVKRTIALVVDDLGLSFQSTYYVRQALRDFVNKQMQPGDLVAVIRTSGGVGALQQFSSDKRQLLAAIERVKWFSGGRSGIGAFAPIEDISQQSEGMVAADKELNEFREDLFAVGTLGAVSYVVRGLKELPGRKSILLISDGFRIYSQDDPTRNIRALDQLKRLIDQAGRASVVIYTMNATGLQTMMLSAADSTGEMSSEQIEQQLSNRRIQAFESQEGLTYLAEETGGIAIRNTNDLGGGIKRVMEDQKGYYLIGYRPEESTFDPRTGRRTFHKLRLKVLRPGKFKVRMRHGFIGVSDKESVAAAPATPREQIMKALFSPFGSADVHVRLTSLFSNDAKLGSMARSMLHVKGDDLTFVDTQDGWHKTTFDVVAVTFNANGEVVDQVGRTHTLRVKGDGYQHVLNDGFVYFVTFPIKKPGAFQLRVALRDHDSQRVGSATQFIEVPDIKKNRLTLSSVIVTGKDLQKKKPAENSSAGAAAPADSGEEVEDATNTAAVRRFHVGSVLSYVLAIYNAKLDKSTASLQVHTQVRLFRDGNPVFTGKEQPLVPGNVTDMKRVPAGGSLILGSDLTPGEYVFQIVVTDLLADAKHRVATQWIDFELIK